MNGNFPTVVTPSPGGCGTAQVPFYNTYSPAFACPGENQGVNSVAAPTQGMIFGLTTPTASFFIPNKTTTQYVIFGQDSTTSPCATLALKGLPDGAALTPATNFEQNDQATVLDCVTEHRLVVTNLLISTTNTAVQQFNGEQTYPSVCNPCFNASVVATCTGSCANQFTASNIAMGAGASFTLIVPANSGDVTVQVCSGCQVETPAFTSCGVPQPTLAQAPVANYCPPVVAPTAFVRQ